MRRETFSIALPNGLGQKRPSGINATFGGNMDTQLNYGNWIRKKNLLILGLCTLAVKLAQQHSEVEVIGMDY